MAIAIRTPGDRANDGAEAGGARATRHRRGLEVHAPALGHRLLAGTNTAWIWLFVRVYVGWRWLASASARLHDVAAPVRTAAPASGFLPAHLLAHPIFWSRVVAEADSVLGLAVLLGAWTGLSVVLALLLAATTSLLGVMSLDPGTLGLSLALLLAWRVAGWWGLDRWILPALGCRLHAGAAPAAQSPSP